MIKFIHQRTVFAPPPWFPSATVMISKLIGIFVHGIAGQLYVGLTDMLGNNVDWRYVNEKV